MFALATAKRAACGTLFSLLLCGQALSETKTAEEPKSTVDPAESAYLTRSLVFVDAPDIERYLRSVIKGLLDASHVVLPLPDILIQSSDAFDAFTDSKQNLVISTAVLREISSEDELAALLGHELSHLILRHPQRKDAMRSVPLGLDTAGYMRATADRLHGASGQVYSGNLSKFGERGLVNTQTASLLWSDVLAPSWNRRQERAADENGLLLMRAAGYNPSAFGTLFQRLHAAQTKRSQRMELLGQIMLARARESAAKSHANLQQGERNAVTEKFDQVSAGLRDKMTEVGVKHVINVLTSFNREYDSPDVRQQNLSKFAHDHRVTGEPPAKPAAHLTDALRQGRGGWLLGLDAAAIRALNALTTRNMATAQSAMAPLLAATPSGNPPTPHLNLALGAWQEANQHPNQGEARARAWLTARRPPPTAYIWLAYHQFQRKEYRAAIATMERGRRRVGNGAPFLPHLVSVARTAGDNTAAEKYALECQQEDRKNVTGAITAFFGGSRVPSGLYADCVQRLGHEPQSALDSSAVMQTVKHPVESTKSFAEKIRSKFRRSGK